MALPPSLPQAVRDGGHSVPRSAGPCSQGAGARLRNSAVVVCRQLYPDDIASRATPWCSCWEPGVWGRAQLCQLPKTDYAMPLSRDSHSSTGEMRKSYTLFWECQESSWFCLARCSAYRAWGRRRKGVGRRRGEQICLQSTLPVTHPPSL